MPLFLWFIQLFQLEKQKMECVNQYDDHQYNDTQCGNEYFDGGYPVWFPPQQIYDVNWQQNWCFPQAPPLPHNALIAPPPQQLPLLNMNNFISNIPIQDLNPTDTNKDLHNDKCWYRYATMGNGTYETVQNAINSGYDINKQICYTWNDKLIVRPALEISIFNFQYDYAMLLVTMNAHISHNTLYVAFTAGAFATHVYNYMMPDCTLVYYYYDIVTFYHQSYYECVKKIVLRRKKDCVARYNMLRYMHLDECDQMNNVADKIIRINNHVANYNIHKQFFFANVEPSLINYIHNRLNYAKSQNETKDVKMDANNEKRDVGDERE